MSLRAQNRIPRVVIYFDQNIACIFNIDLLNTFNNLLKVWLKFILITFIIYNIANYICKFLIYLRDK